MRNGVFMDFKFSYDGVMGCGTEEATGPGLLFVLLLSSTLLCCRPAELILSLFFFLNFQILLPLPLDSFPRLSQGHGYHGHTHPNQSWGKVGGGVIQFF